MMLLSFLIWSGAFFALLGAFNVLLPLRMFGLRTRGRALALALAGVACVVMGFVLPGAEARTANSRQLIDAYVPTDHFRESHWERMRATPREIFSAIHAVRPSEIRGLDALMWMRSPRGPLSPEEKAMARRPILELMTRANFVMLVEHPGDEMVVGTIGQFWSGRSVPIRTPAQFRAFRDPRFAKVAMNFRVRDEGNGWCKVTTETRIVCPDPGARSRFDSYWRVIYPGSAIIRNQWLAAIRRRAESARSVETPRAMRRTPAAAPAIPATDPRAPSRPRTHPAEHLPA